MAMTVKVSDFVKVVEDDEDPDVSFLEQEEFADRLREYRRGDYHFVGVYARTELMIPHGDHHIVHQIRSPGLWGIESDSGDYLDEVFKDECAVLADMLRQLSGMTVEEAPASP